MCTECVELNSNQCTACQAPWFLYNYGCVASCPVGWVGFQGACYACQDCTSNSCMAVVSNSQFSYFAVSTTCCMPKLCQACAASPYVSGSTICTLCQTGYSPTLGGDQCIKSCAANQAMGWTGCENCPTNCQNCIVPSTPTTASYVAPTCYQCNTGFSKALNGNCVNSCTAGQVMGETGCVSCTPNCQTCILSSTIIGGTKCTACNGLYALTTNGNSVTCVLHIIFPIKLNEVTSHSRRKSKIQSKLSS